VDEKILTSILVKPAGSDCNMACAYCFYKGKKFLQPIPEKPRMNNDVLEEMIRQILTQPQNEISIGWSGSGECTRMPWEGLCFRKGPTPEEMNLARAAAGLNIKDAMDDRNRTAPEKPRRSNLMIS